MRNSSNTRIEKRSSNLEFLRIISMVLIIIYHYVLHSDFLWRQGTFEISKVLVNILSLGGKIGVNCFILITGYFMINSKFKMKKLIKLILEVLFYSISIFIVCYCVFDIKIEAKMIIKSIIPIASNTYWFVTTYVLLYIFVPFLNNFIQNLKKEDHFRICLLCIMIFSIIPTFTFFNMKVSNLIWFIILYLIATYISKYPNPYFDSKKVNIIMTMGTGLMLIFSVIFLSIIGIKIQGISHYINYFGEMNSILVLICSISLFLTFKNIEIKNNKLINIVASSMFGVYLIHDNFMFRDIMWNQLFKNPVHMQPFEIVIRAFIEMFIILMIGVIIDQIRIHTLEKVVWELLDKKLDMIEKVWQNKWEKIQEKLKI